MKIEEAINNNNIIFDNDGTLDSNGIRTFKTCEAYRNYMSGEPDGKNDKKTNPVPEDAMSLAELKKKPREEILGIINFVGSMDNKSDIRKMYAEGYGFPWTELETIAKYEGFEKDSGNSRQVHYSEAGLVERPPRRENPDLQREIWDSSKDKSDWVRLPIFMLRDDYKTFKGIVKDQTVRGLEEAGQVVIFGKMLEQFYI